LLNYPKPRPLESVTSNISQFIFDVIINPFFVGREAIFGAAAPAAQRNRRSISSYLKGCPAPAALEKKAVHNQKPSTKWCERGKYCKDGVLSNKDKSF